MPTKKYIQAIDGDGITSTGGSLDDTLIGGIGNQQLWGTAGNDLLIAGTGDQALYGGSDNDYLIAGYGNDTLDGGSGYDVVDFSRLVGRLDIDQDLHTATLYDLTTGAALYTYSVTSFDKIIGTATGTEFDAAANTARTYIGGAGDDIYHSESGGDLVTLGGGHDVMGWMRKYVAVGHVDEVTDFTVGMDRLDLTDFLKGQTIKNPNYSDVVRLAGTTDAAGSAATLVQGLVNGAWYDIVRLDNVAVGSVTLADLGLVKP